MPPEISGRSLQLATTHYGHATACISDVGIVEEVRLEAVLDQDAPAIFASEASNVFVGLNTFHLPPFEDNSKRFSAELYGLQFRMIEMTKK